MRGRIILSPGKISAKKQTSDDNLLDFGYFGLDFFTFLYETGFPGEGEYGFFIVFHTRLDEGIMTE